MGQITAYAAAPSNATPLFVPAADAVRNLVAQADSGQVQIDWAAGVTIKIVQPTSVTVSGAEIPVDGVKLIQAQAQTVDTPTDGGTADSASTAEAPTQPA